MTRMNPSIRYVLVSAVLTLFAGALLASVQPFSMSLSTSDTRWRVVLDGVMGGLSSGEVESTDQGIRFHGELSLENNGGFSQIRTPIERGSLSGADGIEIEVRGDGRSYIFDARVANFRMNAGSYQHSFGTSDGRWTTVRLPFDGFRYHAFGERLPGVGKINEDMIDSLGVTLADKKPGDFVLEIRAIRGYVGGGVRDARLRDLSERLGLSGDTQEEADTPPMDERDRRLAKLVELLDGSDAGQRMTRSGDRAVSVSFADRVTELCVLAIDRGVPLFNGGDRAGCAAVYEVTLASVLVLGEDELDERTRSLIHASLSEGQRLHDASERAWRYRRTLDRLIQMFSGHA